MKNKNIIFIIIAILFIIFLMGAGCQTTENTQQTNQNQTDNQSQQTDQTKSTTGDEQKKEAKGKLEEIKTILIQTQEMGGTVDNSEELRLAQELYDEAAGYLEQGDMEKFNEIIEKARQQAELAYTEVGKMKAEEYAGQLEELKDMIKDYENVPAFKADFEEIKKLEETAKQNIENGDYADAVVNYQKAINSAMKVNQTMESYKDYVMFEYPKLLDMLDQMYEEQSYIYFKDNFEKYKSLIREIEFKIKDNDFIAAKELVESAKILGESTLKATGEQIVMINEIEAQRYLFETKNILDNLAMEEETFTDSEKDLFQQLLADYSEAEEYYKQQKYTDSIAVSKQIIMQSAQFFIITEKSGKYYTVKLNPERRDCLWRIAGYFYNNPYLWPLIWIANLDLIANPDLIFPGQVLFIPDLQSGGSN